MDKCNYCSNRYVCGEEMEYRCKEYNLYLHFDKDFIEILKEKDVANNKYKELSEESSVKLQKNQKQYNQNITDTQNVIVY